MSKKSRRTAIVPRLILRAACAAVVPVLGAGCSSSRTIALAINGFSGGAGSGGQQGSGGAQVISLAINGFSNGSGGKGTAGRANPGSGGLGGTAGRGTGGAHLIVLAINGFSGGAGSTPKPDAGPGDQDAG